VSNLGTQNVTLYAVEGLREVTASIMAGLAFVTTHNLAASLAGSVAVQVSRPAAEAAAAAPFKVSLLHYKVASTQPC
jgi:hypothetical protein